MNVFLFHVITGRRYFLHKFDVTQRFGAIAMLLRSLKQVFWKRSAFYVRYHQNNTSMLLILKVPNKFSTSQIFSKKKKNLLIAFLLHYFILWISTIFFMNEIFKTQKLSEGMCFIKSCNQIFMTCICFYKLLLTSENKIIWHLLYKQLLYKCYKYKKITWNSTQKK